MSMTSVSLSCAIRPARSGGSSGNATAGPAAGSREEGGVQSTFGAGAVPATPRTPGVPQPSSAAQAVTPKVTGRKGWGGAAPRTATSGGRGADRAGIVLCTKKGLGAAAAALYEEDAEGRRLRERLAEQLRVAPSLRYEGKGRPTKRERREIEKLRGE